MLRENEYYIYGCSFNVNNPHGKEYHFKSKCPDLVGKIAIVKCRNQNIFKEVSVRSFVGTRDLSNDNYYVEITNAAEDGELE